LANPINQITGEQEQALLLPVPASLKFSTNELLAAAAAPSPLVAAILATNK
jgi:hypothetical protein